MDVILFKSFTPCKEASGKLHAGHLLRFNEGEVLEVPVGSMVEGTEGPRQGSVGASSLVPRISVEQVPLPGGLRMVEEGGEFYLRVIAGNDILIAFNLSFLHLGVYREFNPPDLGLFFNELFSRQLIDFDGRLFPGLFFIRHEGEGPRLLDHPSKDVPFTSLDLKYEAFVCLPRRGDRRARHQRGKPKVDHRIVNGGGRILLVTGKLPVTVCSFRWGKDAAQAP